MKILDYKKADLTTAGKLPVIVYADKTEDMQKMKDSVELNKIGKVTKDLSLINGFVVEISPYKLKDLVKSTPEEVNVVVDKKENFLPEPIETQSKKTGSRNHVVIPTLDVEKVWGMGYKGTGVGIAVIDTGIYPHADFAGRIKGFKDFVNNQTTSYDDNGHGTHVSGCAAGSGASSLQMYRGTAPDANLIGIKVLSANGSGSLSNVISGIEWAVMNKAALNIKLINMSLGAPVQVAPSMDPIVKAVDAAVQAGITTVCAAGNSGPFSVTISSPAVSQNVISVGALDDKGTVRHEDDAIADFSSRGPAQFSGIVKPDIVTPGVNITAANAPGSKLDLNPKIPHVGRNYITISGTSMATPIMTGLLALMLQKDASLTPAKVKESIMKTAEKLPNYDEYSQGSGLANIVKAVMIS